MVIKKFGQYVLLRVTDSEGTVAFEANDLRIDFDIRHISTYTRAKFGIYNLLPETVKRITSGEKYVTIEVGLHGAEPTVIADKLFVGNALEELKVPDTVLSLYCYSRLHKMYLEKQVDITIKNPTLKNTVKDILDTVGFSGQIIYKSFPPEVLAYVPDKPHSKQRGSALTCLEALAAQFDFNFYTEGDNIVIMCKPTSKNVSGTDLYNNKGQIILDTRNMRTNPKLGPATLLIHSNLEPKIRPSSIVNITNLLTAGTDVDEEALSVAQDLLKNSVAGKATYQVLSVQHKGSNFTKDWSTHLFASNPTAGTNMSTTAWFK